MWRIKVPLVTNARHPEHPDGRVRQKQVRIGVDAHGVNVPACRDVHFKAGRAVRPLRGIHQLHTLQSDHVRFRVFVEFLNEFRLLRQEARAFVYHGVCNDLGQSGELGDGPPDAQAVTGNHFFITKIRKRTKDIDAVRGINQRELEPRRVVIPTVRNAAQLTGHAQTVRYTGNKIDRSDRRNVVYRVGQIRRLYVDGHGVNEQHHVA